eukprot:3006414-Rhodomonas_salina.3
MNCLFPRKAVLGPAWSSPRPHSHSREPRSCFRRRNSALGCEFGLGAERSGDVSPGSTIPDVADSAFLGSEANAHLTRKSSARNEDALHVAIRAMKEDGADVIDGEWWATFLTCFGSPLSSRRSRGGVGGVGGV